jgi:hypothetical protein
LIYQNIKKDTNIRTVTELRSLAIEKRAEVKACILANIEAKVIYNLSMSCNRFDIYISEQDFNLVKGDLQDAGYNVSFQSAGRMGTPKMWITI